MIPTLLIGRPRHGALTDLVSEMCASRSDLSPQSHFPKNFSRIALAQMFYFRKKKLHRLPGFLFFTKFKIFDLKKSWIIFFREQNFQKSSENFRKSEKYQEKSMKIENLKIYNGVAVRKHPQGKSDESASALRSGPQQWG